MKTDGGRHPSGTSNPPKTSDEPKKAMALSVARFGGGARRSLTRFYRDESRGEKDRELRAVARFTVDGDEATVTLHDALRRGQAEARSLAKLLRRVERIEDAIEDFGPHPGAGVR